MIWNSWGEFFAMGGYGLYVWGSFAVSFGLLAAELWALRARWNAAQHTARSAVRLNKRGQAQ